MELQEFVKNVESNFGRMLAPYELERIRDFHQSEGYPVDLMDEALKISIARGKFLLDYVAGVLRQMKSKGIMTVEQLRQAEEAKNGLKVEMTKEFLQANIYAMEMWGPEESKGHAIANFQKQIDELEGN